MTRRLRAVAVALALCGAACTSGESPAAESVAPTTTVAEPAERASDGVLTIGVLLPVTDAVLGASLVDAASRAVDEANELDGVLGRRVALRIEDEGSTDATALASIERLLEADVDAVVGPASSTIALTVLDEILDAGVIACSPTASALALDAFPDGGRFFRTIPSDSLQSLAIARAAERTGSRDVALAYVDDAYGRPYAQAVQAALIRGTDAELTVEVPFSPLDEDFSDEAEALIDSGATTVIMLGAGADSVRLLAALDGAEGENFRAIVVNDTMRAPDVQGPIGALGDSLREKIIGVAPQTFVDTAPEGPYAANVVDCINLIVLGADQADSDAPARIARQIGAVSRGGASCSTFTRCRNLAAAGLQIDYEGPGDPLEIGLDGDPAQAEFERFEFDEEGRSININTIRVDSQN